MKKWEHLYIFFQLVKVLGFMVCLFSSCSFPFQNVNNFVEITDIGNSMDFKSISQNAFMGGYVVYNHDNVSSGQLAQNVSLGVRLGYITRDNVASDVFVFSDENEKEQFGLIHISEINCDFLNFEITLYDTKGTYIAKNNYQLNINEKIDINNDTIADLEYKKLNINRTAFKNAIALVFLSSQETLNTTMFVVLPQQYSRSTYPSGIVGFNPKGKAIVRKFEDDCTTRSIVYGLEQGDYVLDNKTGEYFLIDSTKSFSKCTDNEY